MLDREPFRMKPRHAVPEATGAKRKYLRYGAPSGALMNSLERCV